MLGATESLTLLGLIDTTWFTVESRDRGHRVHAYTGAVDAARKTTTLPPVEMGYAASWKAWCAIWNPTHVLVEEPLVNRTRRIAGRPDRLSLLQRPGFPPFLALLDLKTGGVMPWHRLQMSVYELLIREWQETAAPRAFRAMPVRGFGVYLRPDGKPARMRPLPFDPNIHAVIVTAQIKQFMVKR